ncbi:hypothetical protein [Noviherbaspirillum sp. Root189]|uniref:hypothetical protein n=1 Tax=Noviherbaspirillum sp. Root189 TaxID=1736487 RepID=UPI0012E38586|nr:hypothetical protein [Noviherbaspirillum sp. Root189]
MFIKAPVEKNKSKVMQAEIYLISYILSLLPAWFARLGCGLSRTCVIFFLATGLIFHRAAIALRLSCAPASHQGEVNVHGKAVKEVKCSKPLAA